MKRGTKDVFKDCFIIELIKFYALTINLLEVLRIAAPFWCSLDYHIVLKYWDT